MRIRWSIRDMMVLVACVSLVFFLGIHLPEAYAQRKVRLSTAADVRLKERWLRDSLRWFESCHSGHENVDRDATRCPTCLKGWGGSFLSRHIRRPAEAVIALRETADLLGRQAARQERGAMRPWSPMPPLSPADTAALRTLWDGQGTVIQKLFTQL